MTLGGAEIALSESVLGRDNQQIYLVFIWVLGSGAPVFMISWHIIQVLSNLLRPSMRVFFHSPMQTVEVYLGVFAFISLSYSKSTWLQFVCHYLGDNRSHN